ncbi:MAG: hypothetical protein KME52_16855 [Desmonostoc geniculatum HA4340-LM1]|jgi:hypothetical protein|nr:hypothetical protein [Desmonostoc geniculatum HA4340-LM1]
MTQVQKFVKNQKFAQARLEQYLASEDFDAPTLKQSAQKPLPKREPVKHLLIGSPNAVTNTINRLHVIGYANVGDWSQLLPTANPDEVMSILIRQILAS